MELNVAHDSDFAEFKNYGVCPYLWVVLSLRLGNVGKHSKEFLSIKFFVPNVTVIIGNLTE